MSSLGQPVSSGGGSPTIGVPSTTPPPAEPMNPVPIILGVVALLVVAVFVLARRQGNGSIYQRHAAIIGGLVSFGVPFAGGGLSPAPKNLSGVFIIAAIASIPVLIVGYFLGKKEPS